MKKIMILLLAVFLSSMAWAQTATVQPKIMVIPYTKQGEDISQVIENDVNKRIVEDLRPLTSQQNLNLYHVHRDCLKKVNQI